MAKNWKKLKKSLNNAIDASKTAILALAFLAGTLALSVKMGRDIIKDDAFKKMNPKQQKMILTWEHQNISKDSINKIYIILNQYQSTIEKVNNILIKSYEYTLKHENDTSKSKKDMALHAGFGSGYSTTYGISLWDDLMKAREDIKNTKIALAGLNAAFYDNSVIENIDKCETRLNEVIQEYSKE